MQPKIKFIIDKDKDFQTFENFIKESKYDTSIIDWAFFKVYPDLKEYIKKGDGKNGQYYVADINFIRTFIDNEYAKNANLIGKNMQINEEAWKKKENTYFELVSELFEEKYWPKGKYIAYATIWGVYPRFLGDKTFQIPAITKNAEFTVIVIAHETLHFIFYEYFLKNYPEYNLNDNSFFIWNVSEAFNEVIQNHPKWLKEFGIGCAIYGGRESLVKKLQKKYYRSSMIDSKKLIDDIIIEIKSSKKISIKD
ncbi:MAG: hypothetical protein PHG23_01045 [Candidatus Pacebacteria bacterium]|nr:hypothetical protein [Candidatus Paceibacterota bacterium]